MVAIMTVDDKRQSLTNVLEILTRRKSGYPNLHPINFSSPKKGEILSEMDEIFAKTNQAIGGSFSHNNDLVLGIDTLLSLEKKIEKLGPGDLSFILPRIHTILALL